MSEEPKEPEPRPPGWQCDLGNGEFGHDWRIVEDGDGDPDVVGGTRTWCFRRCRVCGAEDHETDVSRDAGRDYDDA